MAFAAPSLVTTWASGAQIPHHLLVLVGLVCGAILAALLVVHAPVFAPAVQLVAIAAALCAAGWQGRAWRQITKEGGVVPTV